MSLQEITDADFAAEVLTSDVPVLVEWWAEWCGPCRQLAPVLEKLDDERGEALRVVRINQDQQPLRAAEHRVLGLPTMILFRDGAPVLQLAGARTKASIERSIDAALE
ncbi:thioredoxin domain-containing protein [Nocardioides sp. QY071]|uniref:thioredoxin family protein n=1 Tax=Nocardioides sp. QY071 TaxID=3044187 RepID=UPI00249C62C1|nr:thioredoxin domain-containing protein [Nocardioides sp. QY071]WGY01714.1 thioredoxin domain-containing protein [Nocardioides sp. QY071]